MTLKCSQELQSGAQELPSGAQELPSGTQELQNGAQEPPSSAQEPPSWVQDAPKRLQVEPKRRPRGSKWRPRACKLSPKGSLQRQDGKNVEIKLPCRRELNFQGCKGTQNRPKRRQVALGVRLGGPSCAQEAPSCAWRPVWRAKWSPSWAWRAVGQPSGGSERQLEAVVGSNLEELGLCSFPSRQERGTSWQGIMLDSTIVVYSSK